MFWNGKIGLFTSSCNRSSDLARKSFALRRVSCSANIKSARRGKKKRVPELLWERSLCGAPDACREKTFGCGQVKQPESTSNTCPAQHQEEGGGCGGGGVVASSDFISLERSSTDSEAITVVSVVSRIGRNTTSLQERRARIQLSHRWDCFTVIWRWFHIQRNKKVK